MAELIAHRFSRKPNSRIMRFCIAVIINRVYWKKVLMQNRIPYKISGGTSFFSRAEIKDMMAYLRLLVNQDDDAAFAYCEYTEAGKLVLQHCKN